MIVSNTLRDVVLGIIITTLAGVVMNFVSLPSRVTALEKNFASMDTKLDRILGHFVK